MSDPVTNVDIEDVLASIRRMVLQGPPAPDLPASVPARGRLVLTQALRVAPREEEPETDAEALGTEKASGPILGPSSESAEEASAEPPPVLVLSAPMAVAERATDIRGIEAALSEAPEAWEPDGSEEMDWSLGGVAEATTPVFRHRAPSATAARPAAPPEPRAVEPVAVETAFAPPRPTPAAPAIDDERLRALIAEVLRAELQGELGERMTRNIRKLVRREIFRVLETRDEG